MHSTYFGKCHSAKVAQSPVEGEYKDFEVDLDDNIDTSITDPVDGLGMFDGDSYFGAIGVLFAEKWQPYFRYTENSPTVGESSDLTEVGLNYIIKGHSLRMNINFTTGDASPSGVAGEDVDTLLLGIQAQL